MASKFEIEIKVLHAQTAREKTMVKVMDCDQDENTGFCAVVIPPGSISPEAIVAHAYQQHPSIAQMLNTAKAVAYAVYLGEDDFDIHAFLPRMEALISQSGLQSGTQQPQPVENPLPPPRM